MIKNDKKIIVIIILILIISLIFNSRHTIKYTSKNNYLKGNVTVSSDYKIDEDKLVIYNINSGTTISEFISKITSDSTPTVLDNSNNSISGSAIIKTGFKLIVDNKSYDLSVRGDVLGEGTITKNGAKKIAKHIIDKNIFTENAFIFSADYDSNLPIQITDITKMLKDINKSSSAGKLTATFILQDENAATSSSDSVSCDLASDASSCEIIVPRLMAKSGYTVVGWSTNKDATTAEIKNGSKKKITGNITYYSIVPKVVTVTFDKNTSFDNNTVGIDDENYDYKKTNIEAESLEFYEKTCLSYNNDGCYIDSLPAIYSTGNQPRGFGYTPDDYPRLFLQWKFTDDVTLYARIYNEDIDNNIVLGEQIKIGNVVVEFEKGISSIVFNEYNDYLKDLYKNMPMLFEMKGKVLILSKSTYKAYNSCDEQAEGCTISRYFYPLVQILSYSDKLYVSKLILVHELSHAFDKTYAAYTKDYSNNIISNKLDIKDLYDKYSLLDENERPLRDYSYTDTKEFWAEANMFYYGKKYDINNYRLFKNYYDSINMPFNDSLDELDKLVEKYHCIAKNGYNENASICK